jgi:hypothetical protein
MARYRRGAGFIMDPLSVSTLLDRNQRARILFLAERLERSTKRKGRRNGLLGQVGLQVLRALVLSFQNSRTGLCCPSYDRLQEMTGLCRQSIRNALSRLEATGLVMITRRIVRQVVDICGTPRLTAVQGSNLYGFAEPGPWAAFLPMPEPRARAFPAASMIARLARSLSFKPSLPDRGKSNQTEIGRSFSVEGGAAK